MQNTLADHKKQIDALTKQVNGLISRVPKDISEIKKTVSVTISGVNKNSNDIKSVVDFETALTIASLRL